jgi:hypothetical protein
MSCRSSIRARSARAISARSIQNRPTADWREISCVKSMVTMSDTTAARAPIRMTWSYVAVSCIVASNFRFEVMRAPGRAASRSGARLPEHPTRRARRAPEQINSMRLTAGRAQAPLSVNQQHQG